MMNERPQENQRMYCLKDCDSWNNVSSTCGRKKCLLYMENDKPLNVVDSFER